MNHNIDPSTVFLETDLEYDINAIYTALPDYLFNCIKKHSKVLIKPNWVMQSHQYRTNEWEYIITHPAVMTAVIQKCLGRLGSNGSIVIADAPTTEASFKTLIKRYPVEEWKNAAQKRKINLEVIDLRDHDWELKNGVIINRKRLDGDPRGQTEVNLTGESSEFYGHKKSKRGYHGADYDSKETNDAHNGYDNIYKVSKSVIESDVFINLPKLKTHRKAGITCCLKNLVGINTYKNYLPHHSEGGPDDGGDQFPNSKSINAKIEGPLMVFLKKYVLQKKHIATKLSPLFELGRKIFGDTRDIVRSGNWHGNDTLWRMVLDLNKLLFYSNADGSLREEKQENQKAYIGIVDAILAGEGHGPLAPEPVKMKYLICGTNPVSIDTVCAYLMGFDPFKIPSIRNAYDINKYRFCRFSKENITVRINGSLYNINQVPEKYIYHFEPQFGWRHHIEAKSAEKSAASL